MSSRLETLQISLVEARTKKGASNAISQGRDSSQIEMDDPVLLDTIRTSLESGITLQQQVTHQSSISMDESAGSQADQSPSPSQIPHTLQLLQSKIPAANFIPVATEVVTVQDTPVSQSAATTTSLAQHLTNATTQEVCQWLERHSISKASLDILQRADIDGIFLFEESFDEVKSALKEEGMGVGQISRIRHLVEKAKKEGSLN
eukprot:10176457-Ditylum_brightwellii.AAC.1